MADRMGVGIIGVNAERGWAREAHVPAVRAVDGLELVAVATRSQESADAAASAFAVPAGYGDAADLIADEAVDVVVVASSVPAHRDLIAAALDAGKHVVTEWPVTLHTAETEQLADRAARSGLCTAVGLQARMNPAVERAAELVAGGAVGRVLHATVYSTTAGFGRTVPENELYLERPETGMNLATIQAAHTVDVAVRVAGALATVSVLPTVQYPELRVGDPPVSHRRTLADHLLLHGRLVGGGALAVQVVGGRPADDTPFRFDVVGEDATLTLDGGAPRGFQSGVLRLRVDGQPVPVADGVTDGLPDSVVNVARTYAALRDDVRDGTTTAPTFADAVRLSRLLDDMLAAAASGATVTPTGDRSR